MFSINLTFTVVNHKFSESSCTSVLLLISKNKLKIINKNSLKHDRIDIFVCHEDLAPLDQHWGISIWRLIGWKYVHACDEVRWCIEWGMFMHVMTASKSWRISHTSIVGVEQQQVTQSLRADWLSHTAECNPLQDPPGIYILHDAAYRSHYPMGERIFTRKLLVKASFIVVLYF